MATWAGAVPKVTVVLTERRVFLQPWEAITGSLELGGDEEALQDALLAPRRIREEQLRPPTKTCKRKEGVSRFALVFVGRLVRGAVGMLTDPETGSRELELLDDEKGLRDALLAPGGLRRSKKVRQGEPARVRK